MSLMNYFRRWLRRTRVESRSGLAAPDLAWECNICGTQNSSQQATMDRESGHCRHCGSVMRFRSIVAVLTQRLLGRIEVLSNLAQDKSITGIGMSDAHIYAETVASKFSYTNTFYHCEPLLDITRPDPRWVGVNDFVITSDVFEHVPPPIQPAFDNLFALLKPNGVVVFSVPYSLEAITREHFPDLNDFKLRQEADSAWVLDNITRGGVKEEFRDLVFHGGPGSTLEMRVFCLDAVKQHLQTAGFTDIRVHDEPYYQQGIFWLHPWSLVISAVRPA